MRREDIREHQNPHGLGVPAEMKKELYDKLDELCEKLADIILGVMLLGALALIGWFITIIWSIK